MPQKSPPMQEKIVYFLGAGFSAPLGLPVMSDFLLRSKDLYFSNTSVYPNFPPVLETIEKMGKAKNYYNVDLFNIEEVLSLLEMEDYVGASHHKQAYIEYLRDVVLAFTPRFDPLLPWDAWNDFRPSQVHLASEYAAFVATLFRLVWRRKLDRRQEFNSNQPGIGKYAIITLNYDLVLENALSLLNKTVWHGASLEFATSLEAAGLPDCVPLAKLHGSVDPLTIVPPTWNKVANENVMAAWKLAYRLLADATQIRFIGYSLPLSDTYVRYLLASAVLESKHLKHIDAICLDPTGTVEARYRSLIGYYKFRFRSVDTASYLSRLHSKSARSIERTSDFDVMRFDKLESFHNESMLSSRDLR